MWKGSSDCVYNGLDWVLPLSRIGQLGHYHNIFIDFLNSTKPFSGDGAWWNSLWLKSQRFLSKRCSDVRILHGEMDILLDNYVWSSLWLKSQRFLTKRRRAVPILHGDLDILLDNIPIFSFGIPFG